MYNLCRDWDLKDLHKTITGTKWDYQDLERNIKDIPIDGYTNMYSTS